MDNRVSCPPTNTSEWIGWDRARDIFHYGPYSNDYLGLKLGKKEDFQQDRVYLHNIRSHILLSYITSERSGTRRMDVTLVYTSHGAGSGFHI